VTWLALPYYLLQLWKSNHKPYLWILRHGVCWNTYDLMNTTRGKFISPWDTNVFSTEQSPSSAADIHSRSWIPLISFYGSRKFITFPRAHHGALSHSTGINSYIFTHHKKTHFNLKWSTFATDFQMVSKVFEFPTNNITHFSSPHECCMFRPPHRPLFIALLLRHITNM